MEIIRTIENLIERIEIEDTDKLSKFLESKNILHYYSWNSLTVPVGFNSILETPKLLFSIETGDDIKSCVKLLIRK